MFIQFIQSPLIKHLLSIRLHARHFAVIFFFFFFRALTVAYGSSQARGQIRDAATSLHYSHSSALHGQLTTLSESGQASCHFGCYRGGAAVAYITACGNTRSLTR